MTKMKKALSLALMTLVFFMHNTAAYAKKATYYVDSVEVGFKKKKLKYGDELIPSIEKALSEDLQHFEKQGTPVLMRIKLDKINLKSADKAMLMAIPLVGAFAGSNENRLRGKVELVDRSTNKVVKKFTADVDSSTPASVAADIGKEVGLMALSFIPMAGMIAETALDAAETATINKDRAKERLAVNFTDFAMQRTYGNKAWKGAVKKKKALAAAKKKEEEAAKVAKTLEPAPAAQPVATAGTANPQGESAPAVIPATANDAAVPAVEPAVPNVDANMPEDSPPAAPIPSLAA